MMLRGWRASFVFLVSAVSGALAIGACNDSKLVNGATCQNPTGSAVQNGGGITVSTPGDLAPLRIVPTPFISSLTPSQAASAGASAQELLTAMDADPATFSSASVSGSPLQFAVFPGLGSMTATGSNFAWISSGVAGAATASSLDPTALTTEPGNDMSGAGCAIDPNSHDCAQLTLTFTVPAGLHSLYFDFNFMSVEYPEFVNLGFNDNFVVSMSSPSYNYDNLVYDHQNNPINIDSVLFNEPCQQLTGTGFDLTNLDGSCDAGGTGLLTTQAPVEPGETVTLDFQVMDSGDGIYDSAVMLDNLRMDPATIATPNTGTPTPTPEPTATPDPCA